MSYGQPFFRSSEVCFVNCCDEVPYRARVPILGSGKIAGVEAW